MEEMLQGTATMEGKTAQQHDAGTVGGGGAWWQRNLPRFGSSNELRGCVSGGGGVESMAVGGDAWLDSGSSDRNCPDGGDGDDRQFEEVAAALGGAWDVGCDLERGI